MGIDITRAIVKSLPDELGNDQMNDFITALANAATKSHEEKVKYSFLMKALQRLSIVDKSDLPNAEQDFFATLEIDVDDKTYSKSFELIKDLRKQPIYELRINIKEFNWRFRATFFPKFHKNQLYYCFVFPFLKHPGDIDPTDDYRDSTYEIFKKVRISPEQYLED